jgi:hypothetical protein
MKNEEKKIICLGACVATAVVRPKAVTYNNFLLKNLRERKKSPM